MSVREAMMWKDQDRIDLEAAEWLARRSEGLSATEAAALDVWRTADARHARTFDEMARTAGDTAALGHLVELVDAGANPRNIATAGKRLKWWHGGAALAAAAALAAVSVLPTAVTESRTHETRVAEVRDFRLPDGTRVTLGARSKVIVDFSSRERRVELAEGQAFFDVAAESERPFRVVAGSATIRDIGTKFDVTRSSGGLRVSVLEGVVEVHEAGSDKPSVLNAGQRFESTRRVTTARISRGHVLAVHDATPGGWREGRLAYDDGRLADVVADLNRYHPQGVQIAEDAADVRVTASFRTDEIPSFLHTLESAVPVVVTQHASGGYVLRAK